MSENASLMPGRGVGADIRFRRLFRSDGRSLVIPLDHAVTMGPSGGLENPTAIVRAAAEGGADAVMLRPGEGRALAVPGAERLGIIYALTGRLASGIDHVVLNSVDHAAEFGADAVCGEFKFGSAGDLENVRIITPLVEHARRLGLPFLVTVYTTTPAVETLGRSAYAHACRIAEEIGGDFVKTSLPDDGEIIQECLDSVSIPLILAGGAGSGTSEIGETLSSALKIGVHGAAVGRQAWGTANPAQSIRTLVEQVHGAH